MSLNPVNTEPNASTHAAIITPDDSNDLASLTKGVYVGGAGALKVRMAEGGDVTFTAVPAGKFLPISVSRIFATGTAATNIAALWE